MAEIYPTFQDFWDLYDKKRGKPKAQLYWDKLTHEEKEKAMQHIPMYIESQPDKKYRKDPERYLRYKCFEDEIINHGKQQSAIDNRKMQLISALANDFTNPRAD